MTTQPPLFFLEKPNPTAIDAAKIAQALQNFSSDHKKLLKVANEPKYIYWDTFRHKVKPSELSIEEQWHLVRQYRNISSAETPIKSQTGEHFKWFRTPQVDEYLHTIDMLTGKQLFNQSSTQNNRETYVTRGLIEEAIASSQLEGAHTTRAAAKKMLLENRKPQNESEQMIVNNFKTITALEENFKSRPLSKDVLFELHSLLTDKTIDESEQKRFRRDDDEIVVQGDLGTETFVTHVTPKETFLLTEIERLIEYANDESTSPFIHPIIKAIFIHFWIGYLHPFTDGNGRLARALFYWYLLKNGFWAFMYIPISTVIKKSPTQYAMAYIYTEQDNHDLTYFFDYHIRKIMEAIGEFRHYTEKQIQENKHVDQMVNKNLVLNDRQKRLISYFISDQNATTTTTSHATLNHVSRQTATQDLKQLEQLHLIKAIRDGKYVRYYAGSKLAQVNK